jgi:uncharacterized damage-inducible protein DinB
MTAMLPMTMSGRLIAELQSEALTTRRVLERVPDDRLSWRPHPKSMSLGQLAMHIAGLPRGITMLITELAVEVPTVPLPEASSRRETLETLEHGIAFAAEQLAAWGDEGLAAEWQLTRDGTVLAALPRLDVVRTLMLNHTYHHRGQLTVYLRQLGVPLPPVYGPTADEVAFG